MKTLILGLLMGLALLTTGAAASDMAERAAAAATCQSRGLQTDTDAYATCHRNETATAVCRTRGLRSGTPAFAACWQDEVDASAAVSELWAEMRKARQEATATAQEDPERQEWISIFSAQCRYEGIQDGTPAMSDCIRAKAFEIYQRNEDRLSQERASTFGRQQPGFSAPPNYIQPRQQQPSSADCYWIGSTWHCNWR